MKTVKVQKIVKKLQLLPYWKSVRNSWIQLRVLRFANKNCTQFKTGSYDKFFDPLFFNFCMNL